MKTKTIVARDQSWPPVEERRWPLRLHPYFRDGGIFLTMFGRHMGSVRNRSVLALGAGIDYRLLALHKWAGARVTALDDRPTAGRELENLFHQNDGRVDIIEGAPDQCDFQGRKFDVVVHWGLLNQVSEPSSLLTFCRKLLEPRGRMLITVPNMEAWGSSAWKRWSPQNWSEQQFHSAEAISEACRAAGLLLKCSFYFGYPMVGLGRFEQTGFLPGLVANLQKLAMGSSSICPFYYRGHRRISAEHGFHIVSA